MPFGLTNTPATFQRLMESCLSDLHLNWCIIYLDDVIIFSKTPEEHIARLEAVFRKISDAGLKLKPSKCEFRGTSFENELFHNICELAKIKKLHTGSYRPQTNGQCERFNQTLLNMLGTLPNDAKRKWQDWMPTLTHAYNCTTSKTTGFSPYFLIYG